MIDVKRQDLGADVVYLPMRNLLVLHPDLDYGDALAAVFSVLPDLHIDVAQRLVEQVTPRPHPEPRRWPLVGLRMALAAMAASLLVTFAHPASAGVEFGPDWRAAISELGLSCSGDRDAVRWCRYGKGEPIFKVRGFRHDNGTLYVGSGPKGKVIFVFDDLADAEHYVDLHPAALQRGRAVIW